MSHIGLPLRPLGLAWADVDLDANRLDARQQLERRRWRHGCPDPLACLADKPTQCPQRTGVVSVQVSAV